DASRDVLSAPPRTSPLLPGPRGAPDLRTSRSGPSVGIEALRNVRGGEPRGRQVLHVLRGALLETVHAAFASFHAGNSRAIRTASSKLWTLISSMFTPSGTGWRERTFASRIRVQIRRATSNDPRPASLPRPGISASSVSGVIVAPSQARN